MIWIIIFIIINSIANILFCDSCSKYYYLISFIVILYIIIFILLSISDLFVYIYIISESVLSSGSMMS